MKSRLKKEEIGCEKFFAKGCENYVLSYDSTKVFIEKDLYKNRYTRVFVNDQLVSREKESSKKVEVKIQGQTKIFFLEYWFKKRSSVLLGNFSWGFAATINQIPVSQTLSSVKTQLLFGRLPIFFFTVLVLSRTILSFIIFRSQGNNELSIQAAVYLFLFFLMTIYLFSYKKNPRRAIAGSFFIGLVEALVYVFTYFFEIFPSPFSLVFLYFRFIALRSLFILWKLTAPTKD